jgi:nitroreductase
MSEPSTPHDRIRPLLRTRQIREFTPEPLTDDELDALADVARWTGSSTNSQPWRFLLIRDPATLQAIAEAGVPQTRALRTATAALAIVLPDRGHALGDAYDDGRVAERVLVAAGMLDIGAGITWIRDEVRGAVAQALGLPPGRHVRTIVALGRPTDAARKPKSAPGAARLPRERTVAAERWPADWPSD